MVSKQSPLSWRRKKEEADHDPHSRQGPQLLGMEGNHASREPQAEVDQDMFIAGGCPETGFGET